MVSCTESERSRSLWYHKNVWKKRHTCIVYVFESQDIYSLYVPTHGSRWPIFRNRSAKISKVHSCLLWMSICHVWAVAASVIGTCRGKAATKQQLKELEGWRAAPRQPRRVGVEVRQNTFLHAVYTVPYMHMHDSTFTCKSLVSLLLLGIKCVCTLLVLFADERWPNTCHYLPGGSEEADHDVHPRSSKHVVNSV